MKTLLAAIAMTFVLGFLSTAAAFYMVGGQLALQGPYVLAREWPWIYALVVVLAAAIGVVVGRLTRRGRGVGWRLSSSAAGWVSTSCPRLGCWLPSSAIPSLRWAFGFSRPRGRRSQSPRTSAQPWGGNFAGARARRARR